MRATIDLIVLPYQIPHREALDGAIGCSACFLEEKVVEDFAADDIALLFERVPGQAIGHVETGEIDIGGGGIGAAEDDAGNGGAGQGCNFLQQAQFVEDGHGFTRQRVAADLVAGKVLLVHQRGGEPLALCVECGGGAGRPAADDDQVEGIHNPKNRSRATNYKGGAVNLPSGRSSVHFLLLCHMWS